MAKFITDNSPENRKRKIIAAGGEPIENKNTIVSSGYAKSTNAYMPMFKASQFSGGANAITQTQPMFFSPLHTPMSWQQPSRRREILQWSRFYYSTDAKVAAGIDFYSTFSMNGFKLECKNRNILRYFENLVKKIKLPEKLNNVSHEYYLAGDVFPFLDIFCPKCFGTSRDSEGKICNHPDGTIKGIKLLNPDFIDVQSDPVSDDAVYYLLPSDQLKTLIQRREPKEIYNRLPASLIQLVSSGQPVPLSKNSISHIKYNASDYGTYGNPMLQRLFTILAYKTKLMTANWIVAERLILPIRVVKVGDKDRPASDDDLTSVQSQLAAVANDPNLTIVTHNAFEMDYVGATGKIHNITQELEQIGKEILDGLMLNQAILNGDAQGYTSAQVGVEILIRRLENWRNTLKEWVEEKIFKQVAMMQGFYDEEESKKTGQKIYLYPHLVWNDLQLRDKTNRIQTLMQAYDKGLVSGQTLLGEMDLDYDIEVEKIREEQILAGSMGQVAGGQGGGNLGTMGMGGGVPGAGGGGMDMGGMGGGGSPGGEMGGIPGAPGDGMGGGAPTGGMAGAGAPSSPGAPGAAAGGSPKILKRSEKGRMEKKDEGAQPTQKMIRLTSLERKMYKMLSSLDVPYNLYAQFEVRVPGESRPFVLDFAYPQIGIGSEVNGSIFHDRVDFKERDMRRDQKLASIGWRVLRFNEDAISDNYEEVKNVILKQIKEAAEEQKKAKLKKKSDEDISFDKFAANLDFLYEKNNEGKWGYFIEQNKYGEIVYIGEINQNG